jgi:methylated-DNA-[protein]-cysteine S-methyltransferase
VVTYGSDGISAVDRADDVPEPVPELPARLRKIVERRLTTGDARDLRLDLSACTALERNVLATLADVPYGEVITYAELANAAGYPGAHRAVGSALSRNPIPLLIACHRVVRSDGAIGEFGWGVDTKRALLRFEGVELRGDRWRFASAARR